MRDGVYGYSESSFTTDDSRELIYWNNDADANTWLRGFYKVFDIQVYPDEIAGMMKMDGKDIDLSSLTSHTPFGAKIIASKLDDSQYLCFKLNLPAVQLFMCFPIQPLRITK